MELIEALLYKATAKGPRRRTRPGHRPYSSRVAVAWQLVGEETAVMANTRGEARAKLAKIKGLPKLAKGMEVKRVR